MDEYIKREDALDAVLFALVGTGLQSSAIYAIRDIPTADVAPKSEVDNLIKVIDNNTQQFLELHDLYQNAKSEAERLLDEIDGWFMYCENYSGHLIKIKLAELKKKYMEGEGAKTKTVKKKKKKNCCTRYGCSINH